MWARPSEIIETLRTNGDSQTTRDLLIKTLDGLVRQETLESAKEGVLRYHFQLDILRLWVKESESLVERRL